MRLLAQFVAVLLLVGFVGAYFWWIVAAAAVAGLAWLAVRAYPVARAEFESDRLPGTRPVVRCCSHSPG
jgi:hypothetical protein